MDYSRSNWIYQNNAANTVRYCLGEKGRQIVGCIGINPSTARPGVLDSTMKSVKRITAYNDYDGWVMYNVYPQRATEIKDLHDELDHDLVDENCIQIRKSVDDLKLHTIWLAHGDLIEARPYLAHCLVQVYNRLLDMNLQWKIVSAVTKKGHPRHPLYKPARSPFVDFNMDQYIDEVIRPMIKG